MNYAAPALEQDQPTVPMLDEAVTLAELVKPSWSALRKQTGPLTCEGEEEETGAAATETPEETPDTSTDGGEESFPDFDLSKVPEDLRTDAERYAQEVKKHFQGDYTRKTQTLAEERRESERYAQIVQALQNPQTQASVLANFGINLVDEEEPEELDEEPDIYDEVERLKQHLTQREQAEQQERAISEEFDYISEEIDQLESTEEREFSKEEQRLLSDYARANRTPQGAPDVKGAYELLSGIYSTRQKEWIESKKTPRPPGGGKPGSRRVDPSKESRQERQARMQAAAEQARGSLA